MAIQPGTRVGPYKIVALLGAGGMGQVWRATDSRLQRDVALKVLRGDAELEPKRLKRFAQEARAAGSIAHPGIVTVLDVGEHEGSPYVVTELLEGETLREVVLRGARPGAEVVRIATAIAGALAAAHERGIIHRDLKPENVMCLTDGRVKVLDFGIAKLLDSAETPPEPDDDTASLATETGAILGTAGYMSPEQVAGKPVDARSDLFSLGAILHELLGGKVAFEGEHSVERMAAILKQPPTPLPPAEPDEPEGLRELISACLQKNRDQRPASAAEVVRQLEALGGSSPTFRASPKVGRRGVLALGGAVASAALAAGAFTLGRRTATGLAEVVGATSTLGDASAVPTAVTGAAASPRFRRASFALGTVLSARFLPESSSFVYGAMFGGQPLTLHSGRLDAVGDRPLAMPSADVLAVSKRAELALSLHRAMSLWPGDGTLARVSLVGGAPREIATQVSAADFVGGTDALAVAHRAEKQARLEYPEGRVLFETSGWISAVRASPRGDWIAFVHHALVYTDDGELMVVPAAGGAARVLVPNLLTVQGIAWAPSGDEIWFAAASSSNANDGDRFLSAAKLDGSVRPVLHIAGRLRLHDIAPDGTVLVSRDDERAITLGRASPESPERDLSSLDFTMLGTVSADGKLAVLSEQSIADGVVYDAQVRALDGSPAKSLGEAFAWQASPDGQWVAAAPVAGKSDLMLIPLGAGSPRNLTRPGFSYQQVHWFPDGKRLLVHAEKAGKLRFYAQSIDGDEMRPVTPEGDYYDSFVSPDGKSVVVLDNAYKLSVYPAEGGEAVTYQLAPSENIGGGNNRGEIYVFSRSARPVSVELLDPRTGKRRDYRKITPSDASGFVEVSRFWASADGKAYAYTYYRQLSTLYVVTGLH